VGGLLASSATLTSAQAERPVLILATNGADISNIDPHYAVTTQDRTIVDMIFNALIRFTPGDSSSFEPDIATEMPTATANEDGTQTWSFTLRDVVICHATATTDAYPMTSADVLFSFKKVSNPDSSAFAQDYIGWEFEAPDDHSFNITVPEPISETLFYTRVANYSGGLVIPQQAFEAIGSDGFITTPSGSGPFVFESHTPQSDVTLAANEEYFRGAPQLGGVQVRFVADNTTRELALQSGDVHVAAGLPEAQWAERINQIEGIQADVFGVGEVVVVNLDTQHEILKDPKVREAIMLAMSRENHAALSGPPVSELVYSPVPVGLVPGGLSREEAVEAGLVVDQDLDRAMELLAEAGYAEGFQLDLVSSEMAAYRAHYEVLAEELRQIGITLNLEVVQHAAMHELIREDRNAIVIYNVYRPTADLYLTHFYTSDSGPTNFANFNVDELRDQARAETDPDKQVEIWKQAMIELMSNFAATGLLYNNQVYAKLDAVDYGHELVSMVQLYPGINETTTLTV
jgi:peptide/nickel transport system substrate-binding protein